MEYTLMVCADEQLEITPEIVTAFTNCQKEMASRGVLKSATRLLPTTTSTTVRVRNGGLIIADGPFAETKEQVAGFYIVDCEDLDEAIEVASLIPAAGFGTIEVRPNAPTPV
jgi:hypothetical protein